MARIISIFLTTVLLSLTSSIANADSFGVTLRYWLADEHSTVSRISPQFAYLVEDYEVDVPAVTLRWSPDFWENHDLLLSYYNLDRERELSYLVTLPEPQTGIDTISNERSDFELLVRTRKNENVFFYYGLRQFKFESRLDGTGFLFNQFPGKGSSTWNFAEAGIGVVGSFSENGRHNVFANALVGVGKTKGDSTLIIDGEVVKTSNPRQNARTVDLNLGYQYSMSQRTSLSLRYRELSTYLESELELKTAGIDLGITFNF